MPTFVFTYRMPAGFGDQVAAQLAAMTGFAVVTAINADIASNGQGREMKTQNSTAIRVARAHIDAWSHHDWDKTRELLAPDVHAWVTSTQAGFGTAELTGIDAYMEPKIKAARLATTLTRYPG